MASWLTSGDSYISAWGASSDPFARPSWLPRDFYWIGDPLPTPPTLTSAAKTSVTGAESEEDFAAQIIGKPIPIFVGGQALMGCRICEGPFITTVDDAGYVDMIVTPTSVAVPSATRELQEIRLNGTVSFTSADGGATWTAAGSVFSDVTIEVRYGTEDQLPFDSSITRYGARAVPYRSHILIELKNVPLSVFNNQIPFVSVYIYQDEYLTRMEGLARLAAHARYNESEYEFNVSGQDIFWIVIRQSSFIDYLRVLQKTIGRNWNILPADKLRVFENSNTVTPFPITAADVVVGSVKFLQADPMTVPAERLMGFIDTGRDNDYNTVRAERSRYPIALTASQDSEQIDIPIGMGAAQADVANNKSLLIDDIARDKFIFKALPHMRGLQPGDVITSEVKTGLEADTWRIVSAARNAEDKTSDIVAERMKLYLLPTGPSITSNGGDSTASITINENTTAVTTVTANQEGEFSITGGADSSFFSINSETGVLTITARDYEDPQDADGNNTYVVIVQILSDGLAGTQIITVTIANVSDAGDAPIMDFSDVENSQLIAVIGDF